MNKLKTKTVTELSENNVCERALVGVDEAARILHKSKPTIYRWVRDGVIPCYKIGKNLLFRKDELAAFIGICRIFITPN
ncbi:helix-turn-helix domain-containing protein [Bacteroides sp.]|uniref:helix-turn-helix domain-containing protein n=1 Tax=Bacteroides sp. TaxID=29523 RepID=UPI0025C64A17|nr:helix-turn-helix domain-containing protein [Bacteroides sp.]